jgi:hypothetical protein
MPIHNVGQNLVTFKSSASKITVTARRDSNDFRKETSMMKGEKVKSEALKRVVSNPRPTGLTFAARE